MKEIAIRENHLYQKTYRQGKRYVGKFVAVYVLRDLAARRLQNENPQKLYVNRLGISVSKKVGGAVQRNRAKRIIRAGYRPIAPLLKTGSLIVISARTEIAGRKSTEIEKELRTAFSKLQMFRTVPGEKQNSVRLEPGEKSE